MEEVDILSGMIIDNPDALTDRKKLNALLMDYFPENRLNRNILLMVYDEGILNEIISARQIDLLVNYFYKITKR